MALQHTLDWQGVQVESLFSRPRATAVFVLDGLTDGNRLVTAVHGQNDM